MIRNLMLATAAAVLVPQAASAMTYAFAFMTATDTALGQFTTAAATPSPATGISGTFDGFAITGLSPYAAADNILYSAYPYVSFPGISFTANGIAYNLYKDSSGPFLLKSNEDPGGTPDGLHPLTSLSVTAVPEPASWALMIAGVALTGVALRRRQVTVAA